MYTYKVMIHPNNKQATKIRRTLNKCIECNNVVYDYLEDFLKREESLPKCSEVRKWFTVQKKALDEKVIAKREGMNKKEMIKNHLDTLFYDVSNDALKQTIKDLYNSFVRYFKKLAEHPVKKKYTSYKKSFYVDPYKILFTERKVRLEKIANNQKRNRGIINYISLAEKGRIPTKAKTYYNPRVVLEGEKFYIVVGVDDEYAPQKEKEELTDNTVGIDVNIKEIVTSEDEHYKSVAKQRNYIVTKKKLKRFQRSLSRKKLDSKKKSKNYRKAKKKKQRYQKRLDNIKEQHDIDIILSIVDKKPIRISIEDLDVKGMQTSDNKKIREGIQENGFSKFLKKLEYMSGKRGIEVRKIDRWYPSSKKCHRCGEVKKELRLSERVYRCERCGMEINRDLNAAINIRDYIKA